MMDWGDTSQAQFNHYFNYVNLNRAVHDIRDGKISPWVILNCISGKKLISNMNDDQLELISPAFDIAFWVKKFKQLPADVALVQEILKEADVS
jgi:uroporphyrinogen-III decarboxylase